MTISADSILERSPDVPSRTVDGKGILVDLESGYYFSLNRTGQYIWERFDGTKCLSDVALEVSRHFDVEQTTALEDCIDLATKLAEDGLIVPVASA